MQSNLRTFLFRLSFLLFVLFIFFVIYWADTGTMPALLAKIYNFPNGDRTGHFVLYGIFTLLINGAFHARIQFSKFSFGRGSLLVALFSVVEEISQLAFASHRTVDLVDLTFSLLGVFCIEFFYNISNLRK